MARANALVTFTVPNPEPATAGGVARAASPKPSHNPVASSSTTNGATGSSSSLANSTAATVTSITELVPDLFATPLTTSVPPAASAPVTAPSAISPFGPSSAPPPGLPFGQAPLGSQGPVLQSAHLGQEDDLGESEATGSAVDENTPAERFIKIIENPKATVPTKAPEQRPEPAPERQRVPVRPDQLIEPVRNTFDHGLLTTWFDAGSSRPEKAPKESDSSPGFWAMLGAATLSTGALPLTISPPNRSLRRRVERRQRSMLPD